MLDGTLFFVKSARYGKPDKILPGFFMFSSCFITGDFITLTWEVPPDIH